MNFRRASAEDLPYIFGLEQRYRELRYLGGDDAATHQRQLADPDCLYWIVESEGVDAAFVIMRGLQSKNRSVELKRIAVAQPGAGLGRMVLLEVMAKAFGELGAHRLWLDVFVENSRARHVYRSAGFREEGVMRECIRWGDEYRSLVLMSILESEYRQMV
jgi:RimJ/RimL family protein N-acetyltransferase